MRCHLNPIDVVAGEVIEMVQQGKPNWTVAKAVVVVVERSYPICCSLRQGIEVDLRSVDHLEVALFKPRPGQRISSTRFLVLDVGGPQEQVAQLIVFSPLGLLTVLVGGLLG